MNDLDLIEVVLSGLWAPCDGDPQAAPSVLVDDLDDGLTVNDVFRARRALNRLRAAKQEPTGGER